MKYSAFILICTLLSQCSFGQNSGDTVISKKALDSLQQAIASQKDNYNSLYWRYQLKVNVARRDTLFERPDSAVIMYYAGDGKLIMQELATFTNAGCKNYYMQRYFNSKGLNVYTEYWMGLCYRSEDDPFIAKMEKEERMEYDPSGRLVLWVTYFITHKRCTERRTYWYDGEGKQHQDVYIYGGYRLWDF